MRLPKLSRRDFLAALGAAPMPRKATTRKYLLLDRRVVSHATGVRLALGTVRKDPANPLFIEDKPWEPRFDNLYANVVYDGQERLYKCWYSPFIVDTKTSSVPRDQRAANPWTAHPRSTLEMGICYAVSSDGLAWRKPELGLVKFQGSSRNNIVLRATQGFGEPHGAGIAIDEREPDKARRYKMLFNWFDRSEPPNSPRYRYMCAGFSPDGLHWNDFVACREIDAPGDTHSNWFWAPDLERYVGITRLISSKPTRRLVARTESRDFTNWQKAEVILRALPEETDRQTYAMPAFEYAGVYLGLLMMINKNGRYDTVDCELAWSPDSRTWERVCPGVPLIPRGPEGSYDSKCLYGAFRPIVLKDEIRLYYGGNNAEHTDYRDGFFCLARLRPDGFAGYETIPGAGRGTVRTHPVTAQSQLFVNADAPSGRISVRALDADGSVVATSVEVTGDVSDHLVRWRSEGALHSLVGKPVQLEFTLENAKLYSFTFLS